MTNGTQAIDRAAAILARVVESSTPVSFSEVVQLTDLPRSTVSRLLNALERNGLVERRADNTYRGGPLFVSYSARSDRVESLAATAHPTLLRIGEATGETVNLAVPSGDRVVHVSQVDATFVLGATSWIGVDVPPHCSALGKVMYAFGALPLPDGPFESRTARTVTTRPALLAALDEVRRAGYAVTRGELETGLDAIAAPVRGANDEVVAALGLSGPSVRITDHAALGELLAHEADLLSQALKLHGGAGEPASARGTE